MHNHYFSMIQQYIAFCNDNGISISVPMYLKKIVLISQNIGHAINKYKIIYQQLSINVLHLTFNC